MLMLTTIDHSRSQLQSMFALADDESIHSSASEPDFSTVASRGKALPVVSVIGSRTRGAPSQAPSKVSRGIKPETVHAHDMDFITNEKADIRTFEEIPLTSEPMSFAQPKAPTDVKPKSVSRRQTEPVSNKPPSPSKVNTLSPAPPKSTNIFRRLTTRFRQSSKSSKPISAPPPLRATKGPPLPNSFNKESREAALRARGLLPPLPNPDLSTLEKEQDRTLDVVVVPAPNGDEMTSAKQIKLEWEARTQGSSDDHSSMTRSTSENFKFGGNSPNASADLAPQQEVTPLKRQLTESSVATSAAVTACEGDLEENGSQTPRPASLHEARPVDAAFSILRNSLTGKQARLSLSLEIPCSVPLPPSGPSTPTFLDVPELILPSDVNEDNAWLLPLPVSRPDSPILPADSETSTLKAVDATVIEAVPPPLPERGARQRAASSPIPHSRPVEESVEDAPLTSDLGEAESKPVLSKDSNTEDSSAALSSLKDQTEVLTPLSPRPELQISTQLQSVNQIPVIVESPVEESRMPIPDSGVVMSDVKLPTKTLGQDLQSSQDVKRSSTDPVLRPRKRVLTEPDSQRSNSDRRKSHGLFGSTSIGNLRRSVVGTLSRPKPGAPKSTGGPPSSFDASHLPPSPTYQSSVESGSKSESPERGRERVNSTGTASTGVGRRAALSPTMHNRGSIMLVTSAIEDEESRRLSELAFLG